MKNKQYAIVIPLLILALLVVVGEAYLYFHKESIVPILEGIADDQTATTPIVSISPILPSPVSPSVPVQPPANASSSAPSAPVASTSAPSLVSLSPMSGAVGSTVTIDGSGFLGTNTVLFGGGPVNGVSSSDGGTVLSFTVPSSVDADCQPGMACPMFERLITAGQYSISVRNVDGTSDSLSFTVTGNSINPE